MLSAYYLIIPIIIVRFDVGEQRNGSQIDYSFYGIATRRRSRIYNNCYGVGEALAQRQLTLVYGGGRDGLMGVTARAVMAHGGQVIGVSPHNLAEETIPAADITKLITVETMSERKELLMSLGDAFIVLPGGFGTLEELAQVLSWARIGLHHKPLVLLNVNGYYDHLWDWLADSVTADFATPTDLAAVRLYQSVDDALRYLATI